MWIKEHRATCLLARIGDRLTFLQENIRILSDEFIAGHIVYNKAMRVYSSYIQDVRILCKRAAALIQKYDLPFDCVLTYAEFYGEIEFFEGKVPEEGIEYIRS